MVVHEAAREAYLAATNATLGRTDVLPAEVSPLGSFTDPEYASVGLSEETARETYDVVVVTERFDSLAPDHRRSPHGVLQARRRPRASHHPRLPHRG